MSVAYKVTLYVYAKVRTKKSSRKRVLKRDFKSYIRHLSLQLASVHLKQDIRYRTSFTTDLLN